MLAAVLHGKAGRISIDGEDQSWREVFRQREDLLTATIFGRFPYLSEQGERDFLNIFLPKEHVDELGDYQETIFWSKLKGEWEDVGGGLKGMGFTFPLADIFMDANTVTKKLEQYIEK